MLGIPFTFGSPVPWASSVFSRLPPCSNMLAIAPVKRLSVLLLQRISLGAYAGEGRSRCSDRRSVEFQLNRLPIKSMFSAHLHTSRGTYCCQFPGLLGALRYKSDWSSTFVNILLLLKYFLSFHSGRFNVLKKHLWTVIFVGLQEEAELHAF